jgi:hypothetical protein
MKKLWLLLLMVTPLQLVHSQEVHHAPTVEQCRADQRLWLDKIEQHSMTNVSYHELSAWEEEMVDCSKVDADFHFEYLNTISESDAEQLSRLESFIRRHNLMRQFYAGDAQGKR